MANQPNILFICTDQQFAGSMSCTGNVDLSTPGMDRIAESGTRFERAYCTHPLYFQNIIQRRLSFYDCE